MNLRLGICPINKQRSTQGPSAWTTVVVLSSSYRRPIVLFLSARRLPFGHWVSMDWLNFWDGIISSWMMDGKRSQLSCQSVFSEFCSAFFFSLCSAHSHSSSVPPLFLFLFRPLAESLLRSMLSTHTCTERDREETKRQMQIHIDICAQSTRSTWYIDTFQLSSTYCTLQVAWTWTWALGMGMG